jgi:hypothetical protein
MALPTDLSFLDKKMKLYMIFAHGTVGVKNDRDTFQISKNLHVIGQSYRDITYVNKTLEDPTHFSSIRSFLRNTVQAFFSIKETINTPLKYMIDNWIDFGYFPPGCNMRNLDLYRDDIDNPTGLFEIGEKKPFVLL